MSFGFYMLERLLDPRHNPFAFMDDQKTTPASLLRAALREQQRVASFHTEVYEDHLQAVGGSSLWWLYRWSYRINSPVWLALLLALFTLCLLVAAARSEELPIKCPAPPPGSAATCKVITLSPLEEQALMGERGILDTAEQGRPLDLTSVVRYFRKKIQEAPPGQPAENGKTEGRP